jgi:hypothetical protein
MTNVAVPHLSARAIASRLHTANGRLDALLAGLDSVIGTLKDERYASLHRATEARLKGRHGARSWWIGHASGLESALGHLVELMVAAELMTKATVATPPAEGQDA